MIVNAALLGVTFFASLILTGLIRSLSINNDIIDYPNDRSSHAKPTPRGGGLAIVVVFFIALVCLAIFKQLETRIVLTFAGSIVVALAGYWDDRYELSAHTRLCCHFAAAIWAVGWTGGIAELDLGFAIWDWGWIGKTVSVLGIVWFINLFNFMDGIDGLAASEASFIATFGGLFLIITGAEMLGEIAIILAVACLGFLYWNKPPALIFMGDVCSGFLGYVIAILLIISSETTPVSYWVWLLLSFMFIVDSTVTLIRRFLRREPIFEAHRTHAYQHVALRIGSHAKVTMSMLIINLLILLPLSIISLYQRELGFILVCIVSTILIPSTVYLGAGISVQKNDAIT